MTDAVSYTASANFRLTKRGKAILNRERRILVAELEVNERARVRSLAAADHYIDANRRLEAAIENIDEMLKEEEAEA